MKLPFLRIAASVAALALLPTALSAQKPPAGEITPAAKTELTELANRLRGGTDALKSLRPSAAQIERIAANADDAKKLSAYVEKMYGSLPPSLPIKPEQSEVMVTNDLPGGYANVASRFRPGVAIYAVKFVKPGETLGFALDGFMKVDNAWVMIPKAWRAFDGQ